MVKRWLVGLFCLSWAAIAPAADVFDRHTADQLRQALETGTPIESLTVNDSARIKPLSATVSTPCVVFQTDEGNLTKALVAWGLRKGPEGPVPVLLIERYVTYRSDRPDLTAAAGKEVLLFPGFHFNFDIGQVVPAGQGEDLTFTTDSVLAVAEKARMVPLNGSLLPAADDGEKGPSSTREGVDPRDFAGTWNVDADGRWTGEWTLRVAPNGRVSGTFVAAETQNRYEISGQVAQLPHNAHFEIFLANAQMSVDAFLWTTDRQSMAGTVTLTGRKFGFLAKRAPQDEAPKP